MVRRYLKYYSHKWCYRLSVYFVRLWTGNLTSWFYSNVFHCSLLLPNFLAKGLGTVQGKDVSCLFLPVFRLHFRFHFWFHFRLLFRIHFWLDFQIHFRLHFRFHIWFHFRLHFRLHFWLHFRFWLCFTQKCTIELIDILISGKGVPGFCLNLLYRVSYL